MEHSATKITSRDAALSGLIAVVVGVSYFLLTQRNPTYDGAAFLAAFDESPQPSSPHHPLFSYLIWGFIQFGSVLGIGVVASGQIFAAMFGGFSIGLYFLLLRRHEICATSSFIYSFLLAFSMTVLENATSIELYTPSLVSILLALHAIRSVSLEPSFRNALLLIFSCLLVTLLHLGFSLWVFAVFVALAIGSGSWKRAFMWIVRGALVLAALALWLFLDGHLTGDGLLKQSEFFGSHGQLEDAPSALWFLFVRPLLYFARYAGLILFPAWAGFVYFRRERSNEFWLACISTVIFWGIYSFWTCDYGSFFMPLLPVWGLGSALALDNLLRRFGRRAGVLLLSGLFIHAYLFIFLAAHYPDNAAPESLLIILAAALWISSAALVAFSRIVFAKDKFSDISEPSMQTRFRIGFGISAMTLSLLATMPRMIALKEPDTATILLEEFSAFAPPRARLVTYLSRFRPEVQTGRETLSAVEGWDNWTTMAQNRKVLSQWIREMAAIPDRALYLDNKMYQQRDFVFGNVQTGNRTEIALERLKFIPIKTPSQPFFLVDFVDDADRELVARGLDLFDAEDWGGIPVQWTRRAALKRFQGEARFLKIKYWIGHEDISESNPVETKFIVDDEVRTELRHIVKDAYVTTIDLGDSFAGAHELVIEFSRTWTAPDGRELGAGLYPLEFTNWP